MFTHLFVDNNYQLLNSIKSVTGTNTSSANTQKITSFGFCNLRFNTHQIILVSFHSVTTSFDAGSF